MFVLAKPKGIPPLASTPRLTTGPGTGKVGGATYGNPRVSPATSAARMQCWPARGHSAVTWGQPSGSPADAKRTLMLAPTGAGGCSAPIARRHASTKPATAAASAGVIRPSATAARTALIALAASWALVIVGTANSISRSLRGGTSRSMHSRSAVVSPASASSTAFRVRASASPSSNDSAAIVERLREPRGRPAGLPDWPGRNGRPRCFGAVFSRSICSPPFVRCRRARMDESMGRTRPYALNSLNVNDKMHLGGGHGPPAVRLRARDRSMPLGQDPTAPSRQRPDCVRPALRHRAPNRRF